MEEGRTRTVLLGDSRDSDRYLRVTWHPEGQTVVFSHWHGSMCAGSTRLGLAEASRLAELLGDALRSSAVATAAGAVRRRPSAGLGSGAYEGGE